MVKTTKLLNGCKPYKWNLKKRKRDFLEDNFYYVEVFRFSPLTFGLYTLQEQQIISRKASKKYYRSKYLQTWLSLLEPLDKSHFFLPYPDPSAADNFTAEFGNLNISPLAEQAPQSIWHSIDPLLFLVKMLDPSFLCCSQLFWRYIQEFFPCQYSGKAWQAQDLNTYF